jgi:hypothetical protein
LPCYGIGQRKDKVASPSAQDHQRFAYEFNGKPVQPIQPAIAANPYMQFHAKVEGGRSSLPGPMTTVASPPRKKKSP